MKRSPMSRGMATLARTPMVRTPMAAKVPKPDKGPRPKKCANRACRAPYLPDLKQPWKNWCSDDCAVVIALAKVADKKSKADRADKRETKLKLLALEPLEYYLKKAEKACNAYIRARDAGQGCISCGRHNAEVWNAGHFVSVGANRTLRYDEDNIHLQCARPCNKDKGGNIHEYRKGLIRKIGIERVDRLEGWHSPVKMTIAAAEAVEAHYKTKLRELKRGSGNP